MAPRIDLYPVVIVEDRYGGAYSGGRWLAVASADTVCAEADTLIDRAAFVLDEGPSGADGDAMMFWADPPAWIAVGATPDEALNALHKANPTTPPPAAA